MTKEILVVSDDDVVILLAGVIAERHKLLTLSDLLPDGIEFEMFVVSEMEALGEDSYGRALLGHFEESERMVRVAEALKRTQKAIIRFSSLCDHVEDYFWYMVERIHGVDGMRRLQGLSEHLRREADVINKEVAA